MIRVIEADLPVSDRRRLRGATTMEQPVLSVAPDSRRVCDLRRQVLDVMGVAVDELRGRIGEAEHVAWFRAWCSAPDVTSMTVLAPHTADPSALGLLLLDCDQRLEDVIIVAPSNLHHLHRLLLERVADAWSSDPGCLSRTAPHGAIDDAAAVPLPMVPRAHTLSLLRVSEEAHSVEDHAVIANHLHRHIAVFTTALEGGATTVLRELQRAAGAASSRDELLLVLHGLAAAGWRCGGAVQLDPELVVRRSGAALLDLAPTTLGRLARQAFPARGVSLVLGALGWSPDDVLDLTVDDLGSSGPVVPDKALVAVRALHRLRLAQGAAADDRAIPPTVGRHAIERYTVRRWIGSLGPEYGVHTPNARSRRDVTTASQRLRRLGIRIRDV